MAAPTAAAITKAAVNGWRSEDSAWRRAARRPCPGVGGEQVALPAYGHRAACRLAGSQRCAGVRREQERRLRIVRIESRCCWVS
jgi:hypothetical protein